VLRLLRHRERPAVAAPFQGEAVAAAAERIESRPATQLEQPPAVPAATERVHFGARNALGEWPDEARARAKGQRDYWDALVPRAQRLREEAEYRRRRYMSSPTSDG
jgi:hypothetical protein